MNMKKELWLVLEKYDSCSEMRVFCNSISSIIQDKKNDNDIINIYQGLSEITEFEKKKIDEFIGDEINYVLFSF